MVFNNVCICGGGSLGHVVAGWLGGGNVSILTRTPERWSNHLIVNTCEGNKLEVELSQISANAEDVIPKADLVLFCLPGFANESELRKIQPYLRKDTYVGTVFASSGFFFKALEILPATQPLFGFQRVPFISRIEKYGHSANLLGYRDCYYMAVEHVSEDDKMSFAEWWQEILSRPVHLLTNYYEASITNSNPILHTARLYSMFGDWTIEKGTFNHNILFYEEWTDKASEYLIKMDGELFRLLDVLPVRKGYLTPLLKYYESHDVKSLTAKISSISGLKGITSPMKECDGGWIPDFTSRYFTEDFPFGLHTIWQLAHKHNVDIPVIDKVYNWGISELKPPQK